MRTIIITILCLVTQGVSGQNFINGSFENNNALGDTINLTETTFGSLLPSCTLSGTSPNADLITTPAFCGSNAADGSWYVGITGGGTDIVSMELDAPLVMGNTYTIYYYERYCDPYSTYTPNPMQIGCNTSSTGFGTVIHSGTVPTDENWHLRSFTFTAPDNSQYITVQLATGTSLDTWSHVDGFSFSAPTSIQETPQLEAQLYPNPTNGEFTIDITEDALLEVVDLTGRIVLSESILAGSNSLSVGTQPGVYLYRLIQHGVSVHTDRLVVR